MTENKNRVCCLYRVSTDKQVDFNSNHEADLPMQRKACHKFAEAKQQLNFIKRVRAQTLGRIAATTQPVNVLAEQGVQDKVQEIMQQVSQQSFERRRRR